jgi:hypothetical protein
MNANPEKAAHVPGHDLNRGMDELYAQVLEEHNQQAARRRKENALGNRITAPMRALILGDPDALAAQKELRKTWNESATGPQSRKPNLDPPSRRISPVMRPDNNIFNLEPPFGVVWTSGIGSAEPSGSCGIQVQAGGSVGQPESAVAGAGVGAVYQPAGSGDIVFWLGGTWNWSYQDNADVFYTAHVDGSMGYSVRSFDPAGNQQTLLTTTLPLFTDGTDWGHSHAANGNNQYYLSPPLGINVTSGFQYVFWYYFFASCDGQNGIPGVFESYALSEVGGALQTVTIAEDF